MQDRQVESSMLISIYIKEYDTRLLKTFYKAIITFIKLDMKLVNVYIAHVFSHIIYKNIDKGAVTLTY